MNRMIEPIELDASVIHCETPLNCCLVAIAPSFPGTQFAGLDRPIGNAAVVENWRGSTLASISAMFSQLPCLGV